MRKFVIISDSMKLKQKALLFLLSIPFYAHAQFIEELPTTEEVGTRILVNRVDDVINVFLAIIFIASIFGFIFSITYYVIAGGSEGLLEKARKTRNASIIGSSLALLAYVIIKLLQLLTS